MIDFNFLLKVYFFPYFIYLPWLHTKPSKCTPFFNVISPGAGEGHGEAVLGATLCGVDWVDEAPLVGWGGPPNKSPRRSVVGAAVLRDWDEGHEVPPSSPRRSTSSAGAWAACVGAGGSGFWGAVLVLLRWLERDNISSSEGSLSSPWALPSGPPWGLVGSVGGWDRDRRKEINKGKMQCISKSKWHVKWRK